jgi:hypothetical protein
MRLRNLAILLFLTTATLFSNAALFALEAERATTIIPARIYVSPDTSSQRLGDVDRGREIVILEKTNGFVHAMAQLEQHPGAASMDDEQLGRQVTGWIEDKGIIRVSTPNADQIIFGEAADSEREAEKRRGRRNAAQDALLLYGFIAENLPTAPRAGEAMYRAADIRWQLEKAESAGRSSNKEKDPYMRHQNEEDYLRKVEKKFPGTKWADLAAWDLIDNKLCGDWQGDPKCPEKESDIYLKYVEQHPNSPRANEAIYDAAWRQAALVDLYKARHDAKKADAAKARATELVQRLKSGDDWSATGQRLLYMLQNNIPVYEYIAE